MEKISLRFLSGLRKRMHWRHGGEPEAFFGRNLLGVSVVEFSWGLGLPLVIDSSFLPLFLRDLGASNLIIGAVPTLYFICCAVFPLVSGLLTDGRGNKKRVVILTHIFPAVTTILLGLFLNIFGTGGGSDPERVIIPLFLTMYAVFSMGIGMLLPVWQNYLVTIFSPQASVPALAVMMIAQSGSKLGSSLIIQEFVKRYGFAVAPTSVFFIIIGVLFTVGSLFFAVTRERGSEPGEREEPRRPPLEALRIVFRNRNFLLFLGNEFESSAVTGILAFYATYATGFHGVAPDVGAGLFVALNHAGAIVTNIALGWFGFLSLKGKCVLSKGLTLAAVAILLIGNSTAPFLVVSLLLGTSRAVRWLIYAPAVKQISGQKDATVFFSVAPILTLPLSAGIPLLGGKILDSLSDLGAGSYRIVFGCMAFFVILSLIANLLTDFSGRRSQKEGSASSQPRELK